MNPSEIQIGKTYAPKSGKGEPRQVIDIQTGIFCGKIVFYVTPDDVGVSGLNSFAKWAGSEVK